MAVQTNKLDKLFFISKRTSFNIFFALAYKNYIQP